MKMESDRIGGEEKEKLTLSKEQLKEFSRLPSNEKKTRELLVPAPLFYALKSENIPNIVLKQIEKYSNGDFAVVDAGRKSSRVLERVFKEITSTALEDPLLEDFEDELLQVFGDDDYKYLKYALKKKYSEIESVVAFCSDDSEPTRLIEKLKSLLHRKPRFANALSLSNEN
jgi:hypothetical protein